jgi:predicted Na+-dependent transporter
MDSERPVPPQITELSPRTFWSGAREFSSFRGNARHETRSVLGLGTAQRNIAAALVVANQSFEDPNVVVMVVVVAIVGLLTLMPLSRALGRRVPPAMTTPVG